MSGYLDPRPGESWQDAWRRKVWSDAWKSLEPDTPRDPTFHVGCGTLTLAAVVGVPAGYVIASDAITHNAGAFGAVAGFIVVMLGLGFLARRRQKGLGFGAGAVGRAAAGLLRDPALWLCTVFGGLGLAAFGPRMAAEMGEPVGEWVVALGVLGLAVGLLLGIVVHVVRRVARRWGGRSARRKHGRARGMDGVGAALEREFLELMEPELDAQMLGRVGRERAARTFVAELRANAADPSRDALFAELRSAIEREKQAFRERRRKRSGPAAE